MTEALFEGHMMILGPRYWNFVIAMFWFVDIIIQLQQIVDLLDLLLAKFVGFCRLLAKFVGFMNFCCIICHIQHLIQHCIQYLYLYIDDCITCWVWHNCKLKTASDEHQNSAIRLL